MQGLVSDGVLARKLFFNVILASVCVLAVVGHMGLDDRSNLWKFQGLRFC